MNEQSPQQGNPLQKHFRVPGLSMALPSKGYYYKNNEVEYDSNGEVDVYPMSAADEMILQNPDALLNGKAIEHVIQSCVPQVRNTKKLLAPDLDALFVAIRAVTLEDDIEMNVNCPKCKEENTYAINARAFIDTMKMLEPPYIAELEDSLIVIVKPYTFEDQMKAAMVAFEESKKIQLTTGLSDISNMGNDIAKISAEGLTEVSKSITKLNQIKMDITINSIVEVILDYNKEEKAGTSVTDIKHIKEFLNNSHKKYMNMITDAAEIANNSGIDKKQKVTCTKCKHEWETVVEINPTNFFD